MRIRWEIEDIDDADEPIGHFLTIEEWELEGMDEEERKVYIEEAVNEAFRRTVGYSWKIYEGE